MTHPKLPAGWTEPFGMHDLANLDQELYELEQGLLGPENLPGFIALVQKVAAIASLTSNLDPAELLKHIENTSLYNQKTTLKQLSPLLGGPEIHL